ncbi:MAG TPA: hypothetical protein VI980_04040 [Acidimicrobiia bacterium]|nr:hypothetical protein [Acidimicrobiia bacterium]
MGQRLGLFGGLLTLVRRPVLFWEAIRAAVAMRSRGGVAPSPDYLAWRLHTAYGADATAVPPEDLAAFLGWRRTMRKLS